MKKVVSLFLCLLLVFSACFVASATGATATLNSADSVNVGENIEIVLNVSGCADATSTSVAVTFDDAFELVSGTWLKGGMIANFDTATLLGALGGLSSPDVNGDLFKLVLKANKAASAANVSIVVTAKNSNTEIMNQTAQKSIAVVGASSVTYDIVSEDFSDAENFNGTLDTGASIEDNALVLRNASAKYTIGDATWDNFVAKMDITLSQIAGNRGTTNTSAPFKVVVGGIDLRLTTYLVWQTENEAAGTTLDKTELVGDTFSKVVCQIHNGSGYSIQHTFTEIGPDDTFTFTAKVVDGQATATVTLGDDIYTWTDGRTYSGNAGAISIENNSNANGVKAQIDNIQVALLDTATGAIDGAEVSTTILAPGTPDDATGIKYGASAQANVFGYDVELFVGGDVTIDSSDAYDVSQPGVRSDATLKVNGSSIGKYDITYSNNLKKHFSTDFSTDLFADSDTVTTPNGTNLVNNGGTIKDGVLDLSGVSNVIIGDTNWDNYAIEMDVTLAQIPGLTHTPAGLVAYVGVLNQSATGPKALQLRWNPAANKDSSDVTTGVDTKNAAIQIHAACNGTGLTLTPAFSTSNFSMTVGKTSTPTTGSSVVRHVRVEVAGGHVTYYYKEAGDTDWTVVYTVTGFEGKTGAIALVSNSDPMHMTVDNLSVTSLEDTENQGAYNVALNEGASISFSTATAEITATGTASAKFYGFKASETLNLADLEMTYNGDGTVLAGSVVLPCTVIGDEDIVHDYSEGFGDDWKAGTGVTVDGGKAELGSTTLAYKNSVANNFKVEYDITPYHTNWIQNPAISLIFNGSGTTAEFAAFYSFGSDYVKADGVEGLEAGATLPNGADNYWRLMGRKYKEDGGHLYPASVEKLTIAPNTVYGGTTDGTTAAATKVEDPTTYHVCLEVLGRSVKAWVDGTLVFNAPDFILESMVGQNTVIFSSTANSDATIENVVITEYAEEVTLVGYETESQALKVGGEISTAFKGVLSNGKKFDMAASLIDKVTGFDNTKTGTQTVTLHYGEQEIEKTVYVVDYTIYGFENFENYTVNTPMTTGAALNWNTAAGSVENGKMDSQQAWQLVAGFKPADNGVIAADFNFPSATHTEGVFADSICKFRTGYSVSFGIVFNTADLTATKLFINVGSTNLANVPFADFALDTDYRLEMRIYANVVKGYLNDKEVISYIVTDANAQTTLETAERWGFANSLSGLAELVGGEALGESHALNDNVILGSAYTTYAVDSSAVTATNTLPTRAQAGDKVVVSADINANGVLLVDGAPIFQNAADGFGGTGNDFCFTMPAKDVAITLGEGGKDIATVGTSIREDKSAVRFLNRLYLPAVKGEDDSTVALDLGDITEFGALILPANLLEGDLTVDTALAAKAVAYSVAEEKSVLYDVTGKYVDYAVVVKTKDADRAFVCVPYYVVNGEYVYGTKVTQSINGWIAQ